MYSSIVRKKCKCSPQCNKYPSIGYKGYYYSHATNEIIEEVGTKRKVAIKNRNNRLALSAKLRKVQKEVDGVNNDLKLWFSYHMHTSEKKCENCGADLSHYSEKDWRGSQHHIIDKSQINGCPSVATEILNHLVLCRWMCHPQWHTNYSNAEKMPVFRLALEKFQLFKNNIDKSELHKLPKQFYDTL